MRTAIIILLATSLSTPSFSQSSSLDTCEHASKIAEAIMQGRQNGISIRDAMKKIIPLVPRESEGLTKRIIKSAYGAPRYSTSEYQKRAVVEFGNKIFLECSGAYE